MSGCKDHGWDQKIRWTRHLLFSYCSDIIIISDTDKFYFHCRGRARLLSEAPTKESDIGVTTTQTAGAARRGECHSGRKIKRMEKRKKKSTTKPDWNTNNIL